MYPSYHTRKRKNSSPAPFDDSVASTNHFKRRRNSYEHSERNSTPLVGGTLHFHDLQQTAFTTGGLKESPPTSGGILSHANNMVINNSLLQNVQMPDSGSFMEKFVRYTLPGVAFDSSARDPPPRCHPGTRLASMRRAREFLQANEGLKRLLWIVGPAGVGKSAIMQSIAESVSGLKVSIFFSVNVRDDPSRVFPTLAYQVATKHTLYRDHIRRAFTEDPTIPETSLGTQFDHFVMVPFLTGTIFTACQSLPIIIDGLDECRDTASQCRLLELIVKLMTQCPSAPFKWIIASRPEPDITAFFNRPEIVGLYETEEISIDSSEACVDVERHLRIEFERIRQKHPALAFLRQWPNETDFLLIAAAAKGLFAYSSTAVKFLGNPVYGDPESQLQILVSVINCTERRHEVQSDPMAQLHMLYDHIVERIPSEYLPTTRGFFAELWDPSRPKEFAGTCNWLGVPLTKAYGSLHGLHSVLHIPLPEDGWWKNMKPYHKSFRDYLETKFRGIRREYVDQRLLCSSRILNQVSERLVSDSRDPYDQIEILWPRQEKDSLSSMRRDFYMRATTEFLLNVHKARKLVNNQAFMYCMKVIDPRLAYDELRLCLWRDISEEHDITSWPLFEGSPFLIPISELTSRYYKNTSKLAVRICSKIPIRREDYGDSKCGRPEHSFVGYQRLFCSGVYTIERYIKANHKPAWAPCACIEHFQGTLDLVRKESPEHQLLLLTGLELDGTAILLGRVVHPRDENVEIQFALLNEPRFAESFR